MNNLECNDEFPIRYHGGEISVSVKCDANEMYFILNMPEGPVKLLHDIDEEGMDYWIEDCCGETEFSKEIGSLIESYSVVDTYAV